MMLNPTHPRSEDRTSVNLKWYTPWHFVNPFLGCSGDARGFPSRPMMDTVNAGPNPSFRAASFLLKGSPIPAKIAYDSLDSRTKAARDDGYH